MLIAYLCIPKSSSMTDSMNFGPEWLRNLSSEGSTAGGSGGGTRYQLADYRYGREEMLALFEKGLRAPNSLSTFSPLYSEQVLPPLALIPQAEEERVWQSRSVPPGGIIRGRGGSLERGRISRGRGTYQPYGRGGYDGTGGWGGTEPIEWSPRKDYSTRNPSVDNWRRNRGADEDEGWRTNTNHTRGPLEKWGRSTSWRDGSDGVEERGPPERPNRSSWQEGMRAPHRRPWDTEDHLPEWAMENPSESGGTFDASGAFHGSDDEQRDQRASKREVPLQKSISQQNIVTKIHPTILPSSQSAITLSKPPDDITINEEKQRDLHTAEDNRQTNNKHMENSKAESRSGIKPVEYDKDLHPPVMKQTSIKKEQIEQIQASDRQNENFCHNNNNTDMNGIQDSESNNRVEEEFERMQEDLVKKLVVDEEMPKKLSMENFGLSGPPASNLAPPNLAPPVQDKWYYQDPQGDLQGPFLSSEMAEWFRAGYFTSPLLVKRLCDETFYRLGDLVTMCGGNPFQCNVRIAPLKQEVPAPPDGEMLQYQLLQRQLALRQAATMRALNQTEPWANISAMQQRELVTQQVLAHPQITPEMQFLQQAQQPQTNPLMHMINQMQANKLSGPAMGEKPPNAVPSQLDPIQALVQQMGGLQSMQNNHQGGPAAGLPTTIPNSVGLSGNLQNSGLSTSLTSGGLLNNYQSMPGGMSNNGPLPVPVGLSVSGGMPGSGGLLVSGGMPTSGGLHNSGGISVNAGIPGSGVMPTSGGMPGGDGLSGTGMPGSGGLTGSGLPVSLQSGLPSALSDNSSLPPRPNPLGAVDPLSSSNENEAIKSLLRQLANKQQNQQLDSLWQQNQYCNTQPKPQWQQNDVPMSMWDLQTPAVATSVPSSLPSEKSVAPPEQLKNQEKERQKQIKENQEREQKKKRELEKKEAEEKRKEEQRRQELERKATEEKRKKEEERVRKELEKAKKEAEEKRLRELEEKRRLKEQRKAEEEQRKKSEEQKKLEETEKLKRDMKEKEEQLRRQIEAARQESLAKIPKAAPWSQPNSTPELSLADIQKAEREKRAEQAALVQQQRAQQVVQEHQSTTEKQSMQLNWAKKPPETRKVKSLAEIQQEEQDRLMKHAAETRLAQQKEKESNVTTTVVPTTPWSGQNLTWANTASHWSNAGFWDEAALQKSPNKPSSVSKSNSTSAVNVSKQVVKQTKSKTKKEEQQVMKLFSNGPAADEFTEWCTTALKKLNSTVDIPTFISFLRDIESALEVRDYCREYLGEGPTTQQFAAQFLEKRRMIKPKAATQKDDMSSPAPAITPSTQHCTDFQEVKGKGKKIKKSKMTKVDARILGFSVTAAPDRINVGDRDYVEN